MNALAVNTPKGPPGCAGCRRWARHPYPSRYGRCTTARTGPQPYWFGHITKYSQIDTADVHGAGCAARIA